MNLPAMISQFFRTVIQWIRSHGLQTLFLTAAATSIGLLFWMQNIGAPLKNFRAPFGILSFEFPTSALDSLTMSESWNAANNDNVDVKPRAVKSLWIDFFFAFAYTVMFVLAWIFVWKGPERKSRIQRLCIGIFACLMIVAGVLDCFENRFLLRMLGDKTAITEELSDAVWWCAASKFFLIFAFGVPGFVLALAVDRPLHKLYSATVRPWFEWIAKYPLLILIVLVIVYVTDLPDPQSPGLGVQYLFWDESATWWWASLTLGPLCLLLLFVGYLLDVESDWLRPLDEDLGHPEGTRKVQAALCSYMFWTSLPLLAIFAWQSWQTGLVVAGAFFAALGLLLVVYEICCRTFSSVDDKVRQGRRSLLMNQFAAINQSSLSKILLKLPKDPHLALLHGVAFLALLLVICCLVWVLFAFRDPVIAIWVVLGTAATIYGRIVYTFPKRHFGWIAALAALLIALAGVATYPHRFEGLAYGPADLVRLQDFEQHDKDAPGVAPNDPADVGLLDNREMVKAWRTLQPEEKPMMVVVAVSGGGIRAALWTTIVLTEIERRHADFPRHVRLISGTSGGMLGAAYYVAMLPSPAAGENPQSRQQRLDKLVENMSRESLSDAVWTFVTRDIPSLGYCPADRGQAIEKRWGQITGGALEGTLSQLEAYEEADELKGWRPSLVFSPMIVEDGRRLLISNLDLRELVASRGSELRSAVPGNVSYSLGAVEFYRLFPYARHKLRLRTAVRMNASFPYISPAGVLPTIPPRRVADAGYYDNYGVNVAALWIDNLAAWLRDNVSGVVLVQINDHPTEYDRNHLHRRGERPQSQIAQGQNWLTTPFTAVMSARDSTMLFRNDEQLQRLDHLLNGENGGSEGRRKFFTTIKFEFTGSASLSWYLAKNEIDQLKYCMRGEDRDGLRKKLKASSNLSAAEFDRFFDRLDNGNQTNAARMAALKDWLEHGAAADGN